MRPQSRYHIVFLTLFFVLMAVGQVGAKPRVILPEDIQYHRFASRVSGAEATWVNPAGLAINKQLDFQYIRRFYDGKFTDDWGAVVSGDGVGIAYRSLENYRGGRYREYIFATGTDIGRNMYWGVSYRYVKEGAGLYNKRHFWSLGLLMDTSPRVSLGAVFGNLNRGRIDGARSQIEHVVTGTYRPSGENMIISAEIAWSTDQNLADARFRAGLELFPRGQMTFHGSFDDDGQYRIGFRFNLNRYFIVTESRSDADNNHLGTAVATGTERKLR